MNLFLTIGISLSRGQPAPNLKIKIYIEVFRLAFKPIVDAIETADKRLKELYLFCKADLYSHLNLDWRALQEDVQILFPGTSGPYRMARRERRKKICAKPTQ